MTGRGLPVFAFIACLQAMTWACSSRSTAAGVPQPPAADGPSVPATTPIVTPEAPSSPPAATVVRTESGASNCGLIAEPGEPVATVALTERVDPSNAPHPTNKSERLLFRQLYETLMRADCTGRLVPGLAASWRLDGDGHTWIVTLRDGARFSDGSPVTAADVRSSWARDSIGDELQPYASRLVESIVVVDDRTVAIRLRSERVDMPLALAHSDLAVAKYVADSEWPVGTRPARIAAASDVVPPIATSVITLARDSGHPIRFLLALGDPRDLLDSAVDLLLTRDPAALDYAGTLPQFQSVPLAWQRTHVLLAPGRSRSSPSLPEQARQLLADDAVRGEARGAEGPFWWRMLTTCEVAPVPPGNQSALTPRIVYDASDAASRDLAERFVGLARASGPTAVTFLDALLPDRPRRAYQRATGMNGEPLAVARRLGRDAGYIASIDNHPLDPCRELQVLMEANRWLDPDTIVPLVDTRLHAVVRRGRSGITTEWDGGLSIAD